MLKDDTMEGRIGSWMHTASGKQFFPLDPRPEDICIGDIANGLALDCRYAGQGRVTRFYSVAEHSVHMARYAIIRLKWTPVESFAVLMHDAAEGYLNDLVRAVKHALKTMAGPDGLSYKDLENDVQWVILSKYGLTAVSEWKRDEIKDMDARITPLEKNEIMANPQPWAHDACEPLEGVVIQCWGPVEAKIEFLRTYEALTDMDPAILRETWEI